MDDRHIYPPVRRKNIGEKATFSCHSSGETRWYFQWAGTLPKSDPISRSDKLTINQVKLSDSGYYFCFGLDKSRHAHFLARSRLKIYGDLLKYSLNNTLFNLCY